jgi:putative glycosyltransferase (TIGR04372 family)
LLHRIKLLIRSVWDLSPKAKFHSIWAIPLVALIRAIRPIMIIRICLIVSHRIGHFIPDVAEHLARANNKPKSLDFFYFGEVSNRQWEIMTKRSKLKVLGRWVKYVDQWNHILPGGNIHSLRSSSTDTRDIDNLFGRFDVRIPFLAGENDEGNSWLRSKGWTEGEPYICLLVRDSAYLRNVFPDGDFRYHDYRDSDINTYVPAMEWLASQGVWVLRMGKLMEKPIQTNSSRIIDYAFAPDKSDLLDIWLFANCAGVISTGTGLDQIAMVYQIPQLYLNALPLECIHSWSDMIWVPKNLKFKKTGSPLTLKEYVESNFYTSLEYTVAEIEIVDLSSSEITAAVMEFWSKIVGTWAYTENDLSLQKTFWDILARSSKFESMHGSRHRNAAIGKDWLTSAIKDSDI